MLEVDGRRQHVFEPRLYHRAAAPLGRAARRVCEALGASAGDLGAEQRRLAT